MTKEELAEIVKAAFIEGWEYGQVSNFPDNTKDADWEASETKEKLK